VAEPLNVGAASSSAQTDVVLGAGPLGLAVTRALREAAVPVRLVSRSGRGADQAGIARIRADAARPDELAGALEGARTLYVCVKPPYDQWPALFPPLMDGVIAAAEHANVNVVYADNLYMYGPVNGPMTEDLEDRPVGPKGRTRAEIAARLLDAHGHGRVHVTIGRAADFFGPFARETMIGERVIPPALRGRPASLIGDIDQPHTHIFIDDFARGLVRLGREDRAMGEIWHVPAARTGTTRDLVELVFRAAGTAPRFRTAGRTMLGLLGLFDPVVRELEETLYQFERPFIVDHSKYEQAFGSRVTPHDEAIRATVAWYRDEPKAKR
jgi:nucleoside-diphosphate-sugar epimerase